MIIFIEGSEKSIREKLASNVVTKLRKKRVDCKFQKWPNLQKPFHSILRTIVNPLLASRIWVLSGSHLGHFLELVSNPGNVLDDKTVSFVTGIDNVISCFESCIVFVYFGELSEQEEILFNNVVTKTHKFNLAEMDLEEVVNEIAKLYDSKGLFLDELS